MTLGERRGHTGTFHENLSSMIQACNQCVCVLGLLKATSGASLGSQLGQSSCVVAGQTLLLL